VLVPDDFFDKEVEMDKQFSDYAGAILSDKSRLEQITAMTVTIGGCIWFITDDCINFALEL
jgi:hypothetical protein